MTTRRPLPDETLAELAAAYAHERAMWNASPRAAEVRGRLLAAAGAAQAAAEALGDLLPADCAVAALEPREAGATLDKLYDLAARLQAAVGELDALGARRGGARPLTGLYQPPPRFVAMLRARAALTQALEREPSQRELLDATAEVFALAGDEEPERGLRDLARRLPQNRGISAPVVPYAGAAA